jgi:hypothetical protein
LATPATVVEWQMRAWWSQLFVPHIDTNLRSSIACSLLCLEEPTKYAASGPDSARIFIILAVISSSAWSQLMRWYLPFTSFIGYFRRCEFSVMPCSRTEAPFAQWEPRLSGESNTGSWRTQTPFCTTASIAQPTEQCVQTVRFTSSLPAATCFSCACALPIMLNGNWDANAPVPTATPERLRNVRRSTVRASAPERLRARRDCGATVPEDFLVSNMARSFALDQRAAVVLPHVLGELIARAPLVGLRRGCLFLGHGLRGDRGDRSAAAGADRDQEVSAARFFAWVIHGCAPHGRC